MKINVENLISIFSVMQSSMLLSMAKLCAVTEFVLQHSLLGIAVVLANGFCFVQHTCKQGEDSLYAKMLAPSSSMETYI